MDKWKKLQKSWGEWSDSTFGIQETTNNLSKHLMEEVQECANNPEDIFEHVDCLMMVLNKARIHGFNTDDLYAAAIEKLTVNRNRKWTKNKDGVFRHNK